MTFNDEPQSGLSHSDAAQSVSTVEPADQSVPVIDQELEVSDVLGVLGEAAYEWNIKTDEIRWSKSAPTILQVDGLDAISTGKQMGQLFERDNPNSLYNTVMKTEAKDPGEGVPYELRYALYPNGRFNPETMLWLEDYGRWIAGEDGKPSVCCGLIRVITRRHEREMRLAYLGRHDELTGQLNRTSLNEALDEALSLTNQGQQKACALLIVAIDNLAMLNDAFGFDKSDEVIREVAVRLRSKLRRKDSIGRHSGNKFGVVLTNCKEGDLELAAKRLMSAVRDAPIDTGVGPVSVTVSVGGVSLPRFATTAQKAMTCAQEALEEAKTKHRDAFVPYSQSTQRESLRRQNIIIADEIISALNEGRITTVYQPIVFAASAKPAFYECLVRMVTPEGKLQGAGYFVPAAERLGLMRLLDLRVLENAVATLVERPGVNLAINISAATAVDSVWLDHLRAYMQSNAQLAKRLIVEITETTMIKDIAESKKFVENLHDMGCKVALDDFGAGYTSFRNLKALNVDLVKLDGAFVSNLKNEPDNQFFVKTFIDLARNFGLATVAEWVETEEDAAMLRGWNVDFLQGFLYGQPQPGLPHPRVPVETPAMERTA